MVKGYVLYAYHVRLCVALLQHDPVEHMTNVSEPTRAVHLFCAQEKR